MRNRTNETPRPPKRGAIVLTPKAIGRAHELKRRGYGEPTILETMRSEGFKISAGSVHSALKLPDPTPARRSVEDVRDELLEVLESDVEVTPDRANALRLELHHAEVPSFGRWMANPSIAGDVAEALMQTDAGAEVLLLVHSPRSLATVAINATEAPACFNCARHRARAVALLASAIDDLRARPLPDHRPDACETHNGARTKKGGRR